MRSPLASMPFPVKIILAIILDIATGIVAASIIFGFVVPAALAPLLVISTVLGYVLTCTYLFLFYSMSPLTIFLVSVPDIVPVINFIPLATIICLWNGFKTGWRY